MEDSPFCHSPHQVHHGRGVVVENKQIAEKTWHLKLHSQEPFPPVRAGQFAMFRLPNRSDPLLGRPLAIYNADTHFLEVVFIEIGRMTTRLAERKQGDLLELWLPLGRGFPENEVQHTIIVAGGIGQTPFLMYCDQIRKKRNQRITLLYGARTAERIACMDDFRNREIQPAIATDDGSQGIRGRVTDLIETVYLPSETTQLLCCGPKPMLKAAFLKAQILKLPCFVSLETPMSCGLGICFGCVVPYRENSGSDWDYRRTCVDGPVFDAYKLCWE